LGLVQHRPGGTETRGGGASAELTNHPGREFAPSILRPQI
jgi:hypothetical protein